MKAFDGTPKTIRHVSTGLFRAACLAEGCTINGADYRYDPRTDTLTREDGDHNDLAPAIPGPAIAHCGQWHVIDRLPWWCPACGALLGLCLEEESL